jgi:glycosyltransferase involved in cell wall biosynthesis
MGDGLTEPGPGRKPSKSPEFTYKCALALSQSLVAVEALLNGIPVIASDRGALPDTVGAAGVIIPLPGRLTPRTRIVPDRQEVAPWLEAITRLWCCGEEYDDLSNNAIKESSRWDNNKLESNYFNHIINQIKIKS